MMRHNIQKYTLQVIGRSLAFQTIQMVILSIIFCLDNVNAYCLIIKR